MADQYQFRRNQPLVVDPVIDPAQEAPGALGGYAPLEIDTGSQAPVQQEIGETTRTFNQDSPEQQVAREQIAQGYQSNINATQEFGRALEENNPALQALDARRAAILQDDLAKEDARAARHQAELAKLQEDVNRKTAELESVKPESFFENQGAFASIVGLLSIYLGGKAGQADAAYNRMADIIGKNLAQQDKIYARKEKALEAKKGEEKTIWDRYDHFTTANLARQNAVMTQLNAVADQFKNKNLSAEQKMKLDQFVAQNQVDQAKAREDSAAALAGHVAEKTKQYETLVPNPANKTDVPWGMSSTKPLTDSQKQSARFLNSNERNLKVIEDIEATLSPDEFRALKSAGDTILRADSLKKVPVVGGAIEAITQGAGNSAQEIYERALPGIGARYYQAIYQMADDQTRDVTGASVGPDEYMRELRKMIASGTTSKQAMEDIAASRRQLFLGHQAGLGDKNRQLFFVKPKK